MISTEMPCGKQRYCAVPNCDQNFEKLFKFPDNETLSSKWMENLGLKGPATPQMKVCNQHFEESAFRRKNIQYCAIPTKMIGREPLHKFNPQKRTWRVCCVSSCRIRAGNSTRLFEFPRNAADRMKWVLACNVSEIKNQMFVCERHFEPRFLGHKKLFRGAVPTLYLDASSYNGEKIVGTNLNIRSDHMSSDFEVQTKSELMPAHFSTADSDSSYFTEDGGEPPLVVDLSCEESEAHKEEILEFEEQQQESLYFESTLKAYREKIDELYKKIEQLEKNMAAEIQSPTNAGQSPSPSTKVQSAMKDDFDVRLRYVKPGIHDAFLQSLKKVFVKMPEEQKKCVLIIEEIALRRKLEYNKSMDAINGYTDLGNGERAPEIAERATFIMIKSLFGDWKFIVSYYLTKNGLTASQQTEVVLKNIRKLKEISDLQVIGIVCDQAENSVEMLKLLKVHESHASFDSMGTEIFLLHNYYQLQRSVRDTMLKFRLKTAYGIVDFDHIRKMFVIDQFNKEFKVCPTLTPSHIEPNTLERMDTALATEILSNSVAEGLARFIKMRLVDEDAIATSIFVRKMSDLFDLLDCKEILSANPLRRPLFRIDTGKRAKLEEIMEFLSHIEVLDSTGTEACFRAYVLTIKAILQLCLKVFQSTPNVHYISLGKLGQDALGSALRKIRGTCPSANELHYIVARLTSSSIMQLQLNNFGTGDTKPWSDLYDADLIEAMNNDIQGGTCAGDASEELNRITTDDLEVRISDDYFDNNALTELQVQRCFAGYGLYQEVIKRLNCKTCQWQIMRAFTKVDNEIELKIFRHQMIWYKMAFAYLSHMDGVRSEIYRAIFEMTNLEFRDWYDNKNSCCEHRKNVLKTMITILLVENSKWLAASCEGTPKRKSTNDDPTNANKRMKLNI